MHIDRIEIKGFGKLTDRTIPLKKGMNILYGSNEAGKTSLQWFIKGMFYGLKGSGQSGAGRVQPRKRFLPWGGGPFGGAMAYTLNDGSAYRVERDFDRDTVRLFDAYYNDITDSFAKGRDKLPAFAEKQLGMEEAVFDRTVLIRQMEVRLDDDSAAALAGRLANAGSSGFDDMSFGKAEKALAEALKRSVGTDRTTMQPLDRLEARLGQLRAEGDRLLRQHEQASAAQQGLAEARGARERLEAERDYLDRIGRLVEVRKALDASLKLEAGLKEAVRKLKEIEEQSPGAAAERGESGGQTTHSNRPVPDSPAVVAGGRELTRRQRSREHRLQRVPYILLAAAMLFTVLSLYFAIADRASSSWIFALICGVGAISAGTASISAFRRRTEKAGSRRISGAGPVQGSSGQRGPEVLWGPDANWTKDTAAAHTEAMAQAAAAVEAAEKTAQLRSICSSASMLAGRLLNDPPAVRQALKEVTGSLDELSHRLEAGVEEAAGAYAGKSGVFDPDELDVLFYDSTVQHQERVWKAEKERVEKELLEAALEERYCEGLLAESPGDSGDLQRVEEETVAAMEKIAYLRHRGDALKLAREVLAEAALEIRRTLAPGLDGRMSAIITGLTAGKYTDLRGDDKLALKVAVPESGDIKSALSLSGAAADQMYLALRLAMAEVLTEGGESLPLLMDEVFSQFDDDRTAQALAYLKNAYEKRQVLIFTCKRREVELAREICGESLNLVEL